jgi:hypothetical protein
MTTTELETTKCILKSTISAKCMICLMDIANFYLNAPMEHKRLICIPACFIPDEIMKEYQVANLVHKGMVLAIVE